MTLSSRAAETATRTADSASAAVKSLPKSSTIASGAVCVMPWNEPAKTSVAPNSPSARPQASAVPAARPGIAAGIATRANVRASPEPSVREAWSHVGSTASNAAWAWRR